MKNTNPKFFENWSKEQLQKECARLNQVLADCLITIDKAIKVIGRTK